MGALDRPTVPLCIRDQLTYVEERFCVLAKTLEIRKVSPDENFNRIVFSLERKKKGILL